MAQAQVTLKLNPNELQVIAEALKMYSYAMRSMSRDDRKHALEGFQIDLSIGNNDNRRLAALSDKIRQNIGLQ